MEVLFEDMELDEKTKSIILSGKAEAPEINFEEFDKVLNYTVKELKRMKKERDNETNKA